MKGLRVHWLPWWVVLCLAGCASPAPSDLRPSIPPPSSLGLVPLRTVVVDAGHGGHDPGASHYGLREKDLTLDIARRLRAALQTYGLSVMMTRDRDEFVTLKRRPAFANRIQANLFVSVHVNANRKRSVSGIEVYYPRESLIDPSAPLPPVVLPTEVALPTTAIRHILWDLVLTRTRRQSVQAARHVCRAMRERLQVPCRGVKGARFVVLREAWMPAVLVEVGYMSNRQEAGRLGTSAYRQAVAQAIAEGVVNYARTVGLQQS